MGYSDSKLIASDDFEQRLMDSRPNTLQTLQTIGQIRRVLILYGSKCMIIHDDFGTNYLILAKSTK